MPSRWTTSRRAYSPPALCKKPPVPPLVPIPWPPPILLAYAEAAGPDTPGVRYKIGGILRLTKLPFLAHYEGTLTRTPWKLTLEVSLVEPTHTLNATLRTTKNGFQRGIAYHPPVPVPAAGPINVDLDTWTFQDDIDDAHARVTN